MMMAEYKPGIPPPDSHGIGGTIAEVLYCSNKTDIRAVLTWYKQVVYLAYITDISCFVSLL